jgi:hypothetical protein
LLKSRLEVLMATLAAITIAALPLLFLPSAGFQQGLQAQASVRTALLAPPSSPAYPVSAQLVTVVEHADTLAGQLVQLPPSRVSRVLSQNLVEVRDAREHGPYHFHHSSKYDRLLVLMPPGAAVSRNDRIVIAGRVRTVRGASLTGQLTGIERDEIEDRGHHALLAATNVWTIDGVSLLGAK